MIGAKNNYEPTVLLDQQHGNHVHARYPSFFPCRVISDSDFFPGGSSVVVCIYCFIIMKKQHEAVAFVCVSL